MLIQSFTYSRTAQPKQYESVKVEMAAAPSEGQTAVEAFAELVQFVDAEVEAAIAAAKGAPKPATKPVNSAPPLATKGAKPEKADPTPSPTTSPNSPASQPATQSAAANEPPFEPGSNVVAEPTKKRGRPRKAAPVPEHEKELQYVLDSETLEELFERFCHLRTFADAFGSIENWASACRQVQARYKQLNTPTADPELQKNITAALTSESTAIANARLAGTAA